MIVGQFGRLRIYRDTAEPGGAGTAPAAAATPAAATPATRPEHVSEDEWEGLSPAEREALTETDEGEGAHQILGEEFDDEDTELDPDVLAAIAGDGEPAAAAAGTEEPAPDAAAAADTPAPATDDQPPADTAPDLPTDEDLLSFRAVVQDSELPFSDDVPPAIQAKFDGLEARFEAGEVEAKAYRDETNRLNREVMQHQIVQRDSAREDLIWKREQSAFINARPGEYKEFEADGKTLTTRSDMLFGALSSQVSRMLKDPASQNMTGMQILVKADREVRKAFNLPQPGKRAAAPAAPAPAAAPATPTPEQKPPTAARSVPNLSQVPVAEGEEVNNPFSAILRLSGDKFEQAIERMTPAQREKLEEFMSKQA